ncbi:helix-turn-helix transcriptional regulator [Actinokineospora fastidiosa]|uniref:LuxR family transcriptional regulator n=1 Tax=Actinokineospora fastidiosa TaxID=1816 RepID=A0A918GI87_9PSEU|nr:LuxR family transcriptional regulator [Actinokineospora fastidiosa]
MPHMPRLGSGIPLVARGRELRALRAAYTAAAGGQAAAVLLSGDAGVGKTRMTEELARIAREDGALVLTGRCLDSGETGLPYLPVVEALGPVRERAGSRAALARLFGDWVELGLPDPGLDSAATGAPRTEQDLNQLQLFDAVHALLAELACERPVVLILEDLHWADASTRRLVSFLLSRLRTQALLVLGTYRADDLHRRHPLRPLLAELLRLPAVERLDMAPFSRADARAFVSALSEGGLADAAVRELAERSDGNAFFAEELLAAYSDCAEQSDALPATLVDVLLARIERLGPQAQNVVRLASVGGRRVADSRLRAVAEMDAGLDAGLREAVQHNVLVPEDGDVYTFRHALLREAVYHDLLPGERVRLHAAYARELSSRMGEPGVAAALAHHSMESHALTVALRASLEAASEAERLGAPAEALEHLERALKIWAAVPVAERPSESNSRLLERASFVAGTSGEPERAIAYAKAAVAAIDPVAEPEQAAHVRRRLAQALYATDGREQEARTVIEEALALVADRPGVPVTAWVHAAYATILRGLGQPEDAAAHAREAVTQARAMSVGGAEADALITLAMLDESRGETEASRAGLRTAMALANSVGAPTVEIRARFTLAVNQYDHGDLADAVRTLDEGVARASEVGLTWSTYGLELRALQMVTRYTNGDWDAAEASSEPGHRVSHVVWGRLAMLGAMISVARGRFAEVDRVLADYRSDDHRATPTPIVAGMVAAELAQWRGKPERALEHLRATLAWATVSWEMVSIRLAALALSSAADLAHAAATRRDDDATGAIAAEAAELLDLARKTAGSVVPRTGVLGPEGRAWLARAEAEHSRLTGADPDLWRRAVDAFGYGAVYEQALCRWRLAEACLLTDDRAGAAEALRLADEVATTLGAKPLREALRRMARRARITLDPDATPRERIDLFTPRERAVLALVAQGRTNRQVGDELFISEKTVSVHLSRIMAKLGATRRAEAVAVAYDRGLLERAE